MTIYVDKTGSDLGVGESETGTEPNSFAYNSNEVDGTFRREPEWNTYAFPLGVTLDQNDDFFGRIDFDIISLAYSGVRPVALMGFIKQSEDTQGRNSIGLGVASTNNYTMYFYDNLANLDYDQEASSIGTGSFYITLSFNSSTTDCTCKLYNSSDVLLNTLVTSYTSSISITHIGLYGFKGASIGEYNTPFEITKIKANSGLVEEFSDAGKKNDMIMVV